MLDARSVPLSPEIGVVLGGSLANRELGFEDTGVDYLAIGANDFCGELDSDKSKRLTCNLEAAQFDQHRVICRHLVWGSATRASSVLEALNNARLQLFW
jgi:hypothetical protein